MSSTHADESKLPEFDGERDETYHEYLSLDSLLSTQILHSKSHDEMLFIIQHQTSELWMKLVIHELSQVRRDLQTDNLQPAFKTLSRVARIFDQLNGAWDVLRTLTPSDYTSFRSVLGTASGFQSYQYRLIEYMLGNRNLDMLKTYDREPDLQEVLRAELDQLSIYDEAIQALYRALDLSEECFPQPQQFQPRVLVPSIQTRWCEVYKNTAKYWELYELAEKLVDLEDYFRKWRFNHLTTVERIIGLKRGTGGTSGVPMLTKRLTVVLFPELWRVRGDL